MDDSLINLQDEVTVHYRTNVVNVYLRGSYTMCVYRFSKKLQCSVLSAQNVSINRHKHWSIIESYILMYTLYNLFLCFNLMQ